MSDTQQIVNNTWNVAKVIHDDGPSYTAYMEADYSSALRQDGPRVQNPATLRRLIDDLIDTEIWMATEVKVKGDIYGGLLAKGDGRVTNRRRFVV